MNHNGMGIDILGDWNIAKTHTTFLSIGKSNAITIDNSTVIPTVLINGSTVLNSTFLFGNGIDGNSTMVMNTMLVRDMYYNFLTLKENVVLHTNGYRLFVKNRLILQKDSNISCNGNDAMGETGGEIAKSGTIGGGGIGGGCDDFGEFVKEDKFINACGGKGGRQGKKNVEEVLEKVNYEKISVNDGGLEVLNSVENAMKARDLNNVRINGGGGGSAGSATGGGSGGGVIVIVANNIVFNDRSSITAMGGSGENIEGRHIDGTAGGGGGGGVVIVITTSRDVKKNVFVFGGKGGRGKSDLLSGEKGENGTVVIHEV